MLTAAPPSSLQVTHSPVRGDADSIPPSIAAVVATTNGTQTQYRAQVRLQTGRVEIIQDLRAMTASLLRAYRKSNSDRKAQRVIFYRDGVSEGQFDEVVDKEVAAIKAAFREVDPKGPPPKLTYIICGKRHHIRFYAKAPTDKDRTGNLPAGTVIDRGVTSAIMSDFYLQVRRSTFFAWRPASAAELLPCRRRPTPASSGLRVRPTTRFSSTRMLSRPIGFNSSPLIYATRTHARPGRSRSFRRPTTRVSLSHLPPPLQV